MIGNIPNFASHKIRLLAERSLAQVDKACGDGHGWQLWIDHVDRMAEIMARSTYLRHLAKRPESTFRAVPEDVQADVVAFGCGFADLTRDSFAATFTAAGPDLLGQIRRDAASRFQSHVDRFFADASGGGNA